MLEQKFDYSYECLEVQMLAQSQIQQQRSELAAQTADGLKQSLSSTSGKVLELAGERGASTWLTPLSIEEFGFSLRMLVCIDTYDPQTNIIVEL